MKNSFVVALALAAIALLATGCPGGGGSGDDDETPTPSPTPTPVAVTMLFVHGPEIPAGAFAPSFGVPIDGRWLLSADVGSATINRFAFEGPTGNSFAALTPTCVIDYDRTSPAFTVEAECEVLLPPGTYEKITLFLDPTFQFGVRDVVNDIYTDPAAATGITFVAPAGTVPLPITIDTGTQDIAIDRYSATPFVVAATGTQQVLTFVVDMAHTAFMEKAGGNGSLESFPPFVFSEPLTPPPALQRTQYFTPTADAGNAAVLGTTNLDDDGLRVYFADATQPAFLNYFDPDFAGATGSWAVDHATAGVVDGASPGGYLGVNAGKMCWAMASGYDNWGDGTSFRLCEMLVTNTLGAATQVDCQAVTTIPVPVSGSTYASGCPAITPDSTIGVTLVAQ